MHTTRSFVHVLTLMFVFFKITNYLDWSWFGVFSPLIILYTMVFFSAVLEVLAKNVEESKRKVDRGRNVDEYLKALSRNN